ncbi:MAG: FAD-dependent oxidoreductase [Burkholderiales bacterium]|nr:FAD-dependent oxidoreductase [Burkholderiales bacterium]
MTQQYMPLARRRWLMLAGASSITALLPTLGWTDGEGDEYDSGSSTTAISPATTGLTGKMVVVGGGMAGVTAAKYLRLWGGSGLTITLVEPATTYVSNIMSNLVLNGSRTLASLGYTHGNLSSKYSVNIVRASVTGIDKTARMITLSDGSQLLYDRLVLAPGVEFEDAYGLTQVDYETRTPHAWRAGTQTQLLSDQLATMPNGSTFVMTIPKAPYRCPPGPYERACLVADYLKTSKGTGSKVIVLDENLPTDPVNPYSAIQAEAHTFTQAFSVIHAGVVDYQPGVTGIQIDPATKVVSYTDRMGVARTVSAQVVNPIPPHRAAGSRAGGWLSQAGLANSTNGKWAVVNMLSFESTAAGATGIHVIGDASQCGLPKAGHIANQEAKICADAIVRLLGGQQPDPAPVANSACYSPITATTASWLTAVYQYEGGAFKVANGGGVTTGAKPVESDSISTKNFQQMNTWFNTLMGDSFA